MSWQLNSTGLCFCIINESNENNVNKARRSILNLHHFVNQCHRVYSVRSEFYVEAYNLINTKLQYSSNFRLTLCIVLFPTGVYTQTHIYSPSDYFIFWYLRSTYRRALFEYQPSFWIWNRCLNIVLKKQQWTFLISHRPRWWRDYHHIREFHFRVVFNSVS